MTVKDVCKIMTDAGIDLDATKEAMERDMLKENYEAIPLMTDFSWVKDAVRRTEKLAAYAEARRALDKFVADRVLPLLKDKHYAAAAKRIGLDWAKKSTLSQTEAFAIINFTCMHDDSQGRVAVDEALLKTDSENDDHYNAAMLMLRCLRFTCYEIQGMKAHCGLRCRDFLTEREFFLLDRQLSTYSQMKGAGMVASLVPVGDCFMTTGFGLPVFASNPSAFFAEWFKSIGVSESRPIYFSRKETASFAATTIKMLLKGGMGEKMRMR